MDRDGNWVGTLSARARAAVGKVGKRSRTAVDDVRARIPSEQVLRERAGRARTWAADQLGEHTVALGFVALAAGVAGAALLPVSAGERRLLASLSRQVKLTTRALGAAPRIALVAQTLIKAVESGRRDANGPAQSSEKTAR